MSNNHDRPDTDTYFIAMAKQVATRSTCKRLAVGAVLVRNNHVVSTGYNGSPPGLLHCIDNECLNADDKPNCIQTIHAELNALLHATTHQPGDVLYCTHQPCLNCIKAALSAGVTHIIYDQVYPNNETDVFLNYNGIPHYLQKYNG